MTLKQALYALAGGVSLLLALLGVILPLLPTVPFVLLSGFCFMRSSPKLDNYLIQHPTFGPPLRNWRQHRAISKRAKPKALLAIVVSFTLSIYLVPLLWVKLLLLLLAVMVFRFVFRLPTI